jgi:capsular polysaccharide transport system permease protein
MKDANQSDATPADSAVSPAPIVTAAAPRRPRQVVKPVSIEPAPPDQVFIIPPNPHSMPTSRKKGLLLSALIIIGLPTLTAAVYYGVFATDQYASTAHFVIKHRSDNGAALGSLSLLGFGGTQSSSLPDTFIVNDYLASPQIVHDLAPRLDLRAMYTKSDIDWLARLKPPLGQETISNETLLKYWRKMASVHFDMGTGISAFEVRAFTADDAKKIADEVFDLSEELVNRLATRAQEDALSLAKQEVEAYRERALASLDELQAFQERAKQVDPQAFAAARSQIQAGVEQELTQLQGQLDVLRKNLPEDAPGITQIKDRLTVMEQQLTTERARSTVSGRGESAAEILNEFGKLKLESEFATQAYLSSLASLESARLEAIRQNLYLETFVRPQLAQIPEYPSALLNTLLVFAVAFLVWGIGSLLVSSARQHI